MSDYFKHAQDPSNKHFDPIHITACYLDPVRNLVLDEKKTKDCDCDIEQGEVGEDFHPAGTVSKKYFCAR